MFLEMMATIVAGFAGAGVALMLNLITGRRLPGWAIPVAAGLAMLGTTIATEYGWYQRTAAALPAGVEVVSTVESRALYRPWSYVFPYVSRFMAVDTAALRVSPSAPSQVLADVYLYGRWLPTQAIQVMVDCDTNRRADPMEGRSATPVWREVGPRDPLVRGICTEA